MKRKQRANFDRFLRHPNERIRRYAEDIAAGRVGVGPSADVDGSDWGLEVVGTDGDDDYAVGTVVVPGPSKSVTLE